MSVHRGIQGYLAYVRACICLYGLIACIPPNIGITHQAQRWADSYISRARMRPHVYTRTRIMRARGRAHAPARGGKSVVCSRIRYLVEGCSRIALFSPTHGYSLVYRPISPMYAHIRYIGYIPGTGPYADIG